MSGWVPVDYIVVLLIMVIFIVFGGMEYRLMSTPSRLLDDAQVATVGKLINAIITIVSVYVGASIQKHGDKDK
jgi:hypothetical protein